MGYLEGAASEVEGGYPGHWVKVLELRQVEEDNSDEGEID